MFPEGSTSKSAKNESGKWLRRSAIVIGAGGWSFAAGVLLLGFATGEQPGPNSARPIPCRQFVEKQLEMLILNRYNVPEMRQFNISVYEKQRAMKSFKQGPIYERILDDCVTWLMNERKDEALSTEEIPEIDFNASVNLYYFLRGNFVEITDRAAIDRITSSPAGGLLLRMLPSDAKGKDKLIVNYGMVIGHSYCFKDVSEHNFITSSYITIIYEARPDKARQCALPGFEEGLEFDIDVVP